MKWLLTILVLTGAASAQAWDPAFDLADPGTEPIVDYGRYGQFRGTGKFDYKYTIVSHDSLARASGEGIDPNQSIKRDPAYSRLEKEGRLQGDIWSHINSGDPEADFFVWATAPKIEPGTRQYFTGRSLEEGRHYVHALKAYRAAMILYPDTYVWNRTRKWTWLIGPAAWSSIINLTRLHPELGLKLEGAFIRTRTNIKGDPTKNKVAVTPGSFVKYTVEDRKKARRDVSKLTVVERRGKLVSCVRYDNGQWGLQVDGKPFFIRGMTFTPTKVGRDYNWNWMFADENKNDKNDVAYETWIDSNGNGEQDADEPMVGDFTLLKEMGCNAIRVLDSQELNVELLREMHKDFGIYVLLMNPIGAYTVNSGASWDTGTDYRDAEQRKNMLSALRKSIEKFRDEPWLLAYILGNENNMSADYTGVNATRTNAAVYPEAYAKFLNEASELIHELDPNHPVGVGNLGIGLLDVYAKFAPALDFIGVNAYPSMGGFGSLWLEARAEFDRPVLVTEFGCDAYWTGKGPDETTQANYIRHCWEDIVYNAAGEPGEGNSIGGVVFEWCDEWWKDTNGDAVNRQNREPTIEAAFPDGWSQEEWLGITGQGDGRNSPFLRELRVACPMLEELWNRPPPGLHPEPPP
jgi:hypothetical protein